ncbi:hypothetical protein ILUMI_12484 [Ignelater luminosus]|uniref:Uncharacterized protein n=1 Tax=Ignelater luminosus TaxID=2038154 RepID=A0A8K0CYD2_IGNLU|nr:hypothetical protein ILUMI_12484 [Ignelater luminosus]
MVSSVRLTAIALVVVAFAFIYVESKDCYICDTKEECKKGNSSLTAPCSMECLKIENSKGEVMNRTCSSQEYCDLYRYCYLCKGDKCNSSSTISPSFVIMGIVGAIIAKYYM